MKYALFSVKNHILRSLKLAVILVLFIPFFQSCALSSLLECGSLDCKTDDLRALILYDLLTFKSSCNKHAEKSSGKYDDATYYSDFTGRIDDSEWDEAAIRRILHTFAYGGPASKKQIATWAKMDPSDAIIEILTFNPTNEKLSPGINSSYSVVKGENASLTCMSQYLSSGDSPLPRDYRESMDMDSYDSPGNVWAFGVMTRKLNPVRFKVGMWETNYHLSASLNLVNNKPIYTYYDDITNDLAADLDYEKVLADAALSAAIAIQYNHRENVWQDSQFLGNEDFAREFHQLFFGILGTGGTSGDITQNNQAFWEHENVTVPNTAKALTDMTVEEDDNGDFSDEVIFGTDYHYPSSLTILGETIDGNTAREKIVNAAEVAIQHTESLNNLPIIIIRGLADDNLEEVDDTDVVSKKKTIRNIWSETKPKNLLVFLRRYALSTAFHNSSRFKYRTSIDRNATLANLSSLNNDEASEFYYDPFTQIDNENVTLFRPMHDVFGSQTGLEAASTPDIFNRQYTASTDDYWLYGAGVIREGNTPVHEKPYRYLIPKTDDGTYRVKETAEFLWNYYIGDNLKNMGNLERAHLYAILGSGTDLSYFLADDKTDPTINSIEYSWSDIKSDYNLQTKINDAAIGTLRLESSDEDARQEDLDRVGLAISFIIATPYMHVQEGQ